MGSISRRTFYLVSVTLILLGCTMGYDSSESATSWPTSPPDLSEPLIPDHNIPGSYDDEFRTASLRFLPQHRWEWLKSQCYQESRLDPAATSPAGAMGLCQFMPRTWSEISQVLGLNASVFNPKANAYAASYYMGHLEAEWIRDRRTIERLRLAQASYNGGLGTILKAQRECNDALLWEDIMPCVRAKETREYVGRVAKWYRMLTGEGE